MKKRYWLLCALAWVFASNSNSQGLSQQLLQQPWPAQWIAVPGTDGKAYGVYKFRKKFSVADARKPFWVHVSGDNRYKLYINGQLVSIGPARGDLYFWNFETVDLSPYLIAGENVLAALVWNDGPAKPEAQISYRSAFILQSSEAAHAAVNTNASWRCIRDSSYAPLPVSVPGYYVAGPAELVHMKDNIRGWEQAAFNDSSWAKPIALSAGHTKESAIDSRGWMLVPSPIPPMEAKVERLKAVRLTSGIAAPAGFPQQKKAVAIPANTKAVLLLDNGVLTNAYPTLQFSGGKNATIAVGYAEALYEAPQKATSIWSYRAKGNRNEVAGKVFVGKQDSIISDGSSAQQYTPLWWRTYRYLQLSITTGNEPLTIEDIWGTFTGYPFTLVANIEAADPQIIQMMDIGWRTARLCAFETYMDCPYYEQLQYIGDARIQALVTLYNTRDDRMVRQALDLMDHSRIAEGITLSRYPTDLHQQIPTFSLWYIGMLHDYWRYRPDAAFVAEKLAGTRQVLHFFERYQQPDGSLKDVPYWIFTDWVGGWPRGIAPVGKSGSSAVLNLQLAWTYEIAAEMEAAMGIKELATTYRAKAAQLKATIQRKYWHAEKSLYADTEEGGLYSQHANALALLCGIVKKEAVQPLTQKLLTDSSLAPASIYFKYYLHAALIKAGLGNDYLKWLDKWRENIAMGLTTWAEMSDVSGSRSDCHAWGSSPNIEFFRTVLGIDSDAPGFSKIRIAPHLGELKTIKGSMPHPQGMVSASYAFTNNKWMVEINLPKNTAGSFIWKGKSYVLKSGKNSFAF